MEDNVDVKEILSHPDRLLKDHLKGVRKRALNEFDRISKHLNWERTLGFRREDIRRVLEVSTLMHDLGKATRTFQRRIRGEKVRAEHSLISSLFVFSKLLQEGLPPPLAFCGYSIVRHHHGKLISPREERISDADKNLVERQITEIDEEFLDSIGADLADLEELSYELDDAADEAEDVGKEMYFLMKLLFSILTYSDRMDVVFKDEEVNFEKPSEYELDEFLSRLEGKGNISELRRKFQREVREFNEKDEGIFVLRGPTGIGKTLANIRLALRLLGDGAIAYTLPFVNIIEQTADVLRKVFGKGKVMERHHLAKPDDTEDLENLSKVMLAMDLWLSPIVVTTFVGLLEGLIGGDKAPFFHRLVGGAIILDEIQAIPKGKWDIVREVVEFLPKIGINVILSTATLPVIFTGKEVVENPVDRFFKRVNRTRVKFEGRMKLNEFVGYLEEVLKDGKKTLVVLNTIKSAEAVYDSFSHMDEVCFLSSLVLPKHRRERIKMIREDRVKLCISTQVVEAGVDVSFERVVRDIAPLDSIIQAAGRCNRNFEWGEGEVLVTAIEDERTLLSKYVYGSTLVEISERLLEELKSFEERDFPNVVERYYEMVKMLADVDEEGYVGKLSRLDISGLSDFRIVDELQGLEFLILIDERAEKLLEDALKAYEELEGLERRNALKIILMELSDYIVSARVKDPKELPAFMESFGMVVVPRENVSEWYDPVKGLRTSAVGGGLVI